MTEGETARDTTGGATGGDDRSGRSDDRSTPRGYEGQRLVVGLYAMLVGVAATAGFLTGAFIEGLEAPRFLFLVPLPPSPLGFAAYGGMTVALVLGVPLVLVVYVSERLDDA